MVDGINVIDYLKEIGRFREVRRTTGVSTTDLTGKLLRLVADDSEEEAKSESNGPSS